jgi:hypothetical protein
MTTQQEMFALVQAFIRKAAREACSIQQAEPNLTDWGVLTYGNPQAQANRGIVIALVEDADSTAEPSIFLIQETTLVQGRLTSLARLIHPRIPLSQFTPPKGFKPVDGYLTQRIATA